MSSVSTERATWTGTALAGRWTGLVQVRAHGVPMPATVTVAGGRLEIALEQATTGIAPGQAAVLYAGDRVVGSATISASCP